MVAVNENASVPVFSQFSGRVTDVFRQTGETVSRGTALAALVAAEAAQARSDLAGAVATEATGRKQLELARVNEHRQHELFLAEAGAQKDWDQSRTDLAAAENAHAAAEATLAAARAKASLMGNVGEAGASLGKGIVTAPIDGLIVQRQVAPGQFINSLAGGGGTPLFTVTDLRTVWVLAGVSETDAVRLKPGQPVQISALALPERVWAAKVNWIAAAVDPSTHRLAVRAELPNPDRALRPQMSVTVRFLEGQPAEALAVPRSALVYDGAQPHCYVVVGKHRLAAHPLKVGRIDGQMAEVIDGLAADDQVV
ncbi:MAG TPA: efflux RND transporter periplasmic adaptor subunit, partial [Burkholderiaceae bacterium]